MKPSTVADEQMAQLTALSQKLQQQVKDQEGRFNLMMEQVMQAVQQGPLLPQALEVDRRHAGNSGPSSLNDKINPGVKQMITQAWAKHKKEQKLISCQRSDVHQILLTSWDHEMRDCMNETFSIEFTFPNILATEVFTDTETNCQKCPSTWPSCW